MQVALQNVCCWLTNPGSEDLIGQTHFCLPSFKVTAIINRQSVKLIFTI